MYKLIAIDMDGTLLNDQHEITPEVRETLLEARSKGSHIVLCTGRPIGGVHRYLDELGLTDEGDYVIAYNGALVQDTHTGRVVNELSLTHENLEELYEVSRELDTPMHYFDSEQVYTPNKDISRYTILEAHLTQLPLSYRKVEEMPKGTLFPKVMFIHDPEKLSEVIAAVPDSLKQKYTMVQSAPYFFEILHPQASKGSAVQQLAESLDITREQVMCIGDNGNDLSMIQYAGCGVAMENAIPVIKQHADYETLSNNAHGVADAIQKLVLAKHPSS
ncbi:hypothetical protein ATL39_2922 [Sinobaca qinghaiensis]|uniref:Sugar-phosphatase n=1 Tax=Sinobaca qinghaiensis TaxID=342944 RepID=A0A419UWI8_9BACL|nr:sugar-phosphatase [Sinobaca qinghaiensis]RKD69503.1 hypothetical protein ATL39_2922 [Sinobaca qinghaiensis]